MIASKKRKKVFVTLGSHPQPFIRLLNEIIKQKYDEFDFFVQTGFTNFEFKKNNFQFEKFLSDSEFKKKIKESDLVISHAGAGTIINTLSLEVPLILVPRLKEFGEHTDNHQLELAEAMNNNKKCISVFEISNLFSAIQNAKKTKVESNKNKIVNRINNYLNNLEIELTKK